MIDADGIHTDVPLGDYSLGGDQPQESIPEIYTALPLLNRVRRRRTPSNSREEYSLLDGSEDLHEHRGEEELAYSMEDIVFSPTWFFTALLRFVLFCLVLLVFGMHRWGYWSPLLSGFRHPPLFTYEKIIHFLTLDHTLHSHLEQNKYHMVMFSALWNPWCETDGQSASSAFETLSQSMAAYNNINLAIVDCDRMPETCRQETILSCPTIRFYHHRHSEIGDDEYVFWNVGKEFHKTDETLSHFARTMVESLEPPSLWKQWLPFGYKSKPQIPYRRSTTTLPTLVQSNFSRVLEEEQGSTAVVVFAGSSPTEWEMQGWQDQQARWEEEGLELRMFLVGECSDDWDVCKRYQEAKIVIYQDGRLTVPDYEEHFLPTRKSRGKDQNGLG